MTSKLVQLTQNEHGNLKVNPKLDLKSFKDTGIALVTLQEIQKAATELPIVFIKDEESSKFACTVLMGPSGKQNFYFQNANRLNFIPAALSHLPFGVLPHPNNNNRFMVFIDEKSRLVSESNGENLFDQDGNQTAFLNNRIQSLVNFQKSLELTRDFTDRLVALELLTPIKLSVNKNISSRNLSGLFAIDQDKLKTLPEKLTVELFKSGYLAAAYAHIISLNNFGKVMQKTS